MTIYVYSQYLRSYNKLEALLQQLVEECILTFRRDPFDRRLDTHRLHDKLKKLWSFSIDRRYCFLLDFFDTKQEEVVFLDIGDHSIYGYL